MVDTGEKSNASSVSSDQVSTVDRPSLLGGRYRIEALLGSGGMGSVYRVRDNELDDVVALKIVGVLDGSALARFRDEVKLARRVTHTNVARTFDIGEHAGVRFLTMEYVPGESLRRRLGGARPSERVARRIAAGICEGIAAIHAADVVHGDLKPENVIVTPDDVPKLSDFGLAALHQGDGLRGAGTPMYMAPERYDNAPADRRSDLFALGVILHELFSGKRPKPLPRNPVLSSRLPRDVAAIVALCLDEDPARRPRDAREVLAALDRPSRDSERARTHGGAAILPARDAIAVAVRPLRADEPHDAYLGAALASDIARVLSSVRELAIHVQPLSRNADADDVDAIVDGSVSRHASGVQVALRLVSRREGYLVWGRTFTVELADVLGAVEDASIAIADVLGTRANRPAQTNLRDPQLIELYLRARELDYTTWHSYDIDNAEAYKEILERLPDDPLMLASYSAAMTRRAIREPGALATAQKYAERALALAPELAEAHLALAIRLYMGNDNEGAIRAMLRGLELAPSSAFGHSVLGYALCEINLVERGLSQLDFALTLERDLPMAWANSIRYHALAGHDARVDELLQRPPPLRELGTEWLYWVTRSRIAVMRGGDHPARLGDELDASPYGKTPLLAPLVAGLRHQPLAVPLRTAMQPFHLGDPLNHRTRMFGHLYTVEMALYLGLDDIARESLIAAVDEGTCDIMWWNTYPALARFRGETWFTDLGHKVSARAERVRSAVALVTGTLS